MVIFCVVPCVVRCRNENKNYQQMSVREDERCTKFTNCQIVIILFLKSAILYFAHIEKNQPILKMENTLVVTTVTTVKSETAEDCDRPDNIFENTEIRDHFCDELKIEHIEHGVEELHHSIDVIKDEELSETRNESSNCKNSSVLAESVNQNDNDCSEQVERVSVEIEKPSDNVNRQPLSKTASQQRLKRKQKMLARSRILSNNFTSAKLELVRLSANVLRNESQRRKNAENLENKLKLEILKIRKNAVILQNKVKLQILKTKLEIKKAKLNKTLES